MPRSREELARLVEQDGVRDDVLAAFREIDRADFVPRDLRHEAYYDRPVPIPFHQTTSQPSLIARMVDAAAISKQDNVLEVGTGYGFQTALLARVAASVTSIDRYAGLIEAARNNLERAGIVNVELIVGDGWEGAPDRAPYQAIVVSAAASEVPKALVEQLDEGGRMVIPVKSGGSDDVLLFVKEGNRLRQLKLVTPARFVPLVKAGPE